MKRFAHAVAVAAVAAVAAFAVAVPSVNAATFADDFNAGASAFWGNEQGDWSANGGVYAATHPSSYPSALSALPWDVSDFVAEFDVNGISDGGAWLRSSNSAGDIGRSGILLVMARGSLYWHVVTAGGGYGSPLGEVDIHSLQNAHFKVVVAGDEYKVFVNGESTPKTTLTNSQFASGRFALYDNSSQTFDNVVLSSDAISAIPEPQTNALMLAGLAAIAVASRRRRT